MAKKPAHEVREPDARYRLAPTLVDSCILIDVLANDPDWVEWSLEKLDELDELGQQAPLVAFKRTFPNSTTSRHDQLNTTLPCPRTCRLA